MLSEGEVPTVDLKLNDFLRNELAGNGVVEENEHLSMAAFASKPKMFIEDDDLLSLIMGLPSYKKIKGEIEIEVSMLEGMHILIKEGATTLRQWPKASTEVKELVSKTVRGVLDAALDALVNEEKLEDEIKASLGGYYESIYDAKWNHIVEASNDEGIGMEVREGKSPQESWNFKETNGILEMDGDTEHISSPHCRLMVLTSEKGWPYLLCKTKPMISLSTLKWSECGELFSAV